MGKVKANVYVSLTISREIEVDDDAITDEDSAIDFITDLVNDEIRERFDIGLFDLHSVDSLEVSDIKGEFLKEEDDNE
jgi:hypothetical protein